MLKNIFGIMSTATVITFTQILGLHDGGWDGVACKHI